MGSKQVFVIGHGDQVGAKKWTPAVKVWVRLHDPLDFGVQGGRSHRLNRNEEVYPVLADQSHHVLHISGIFFPDNVKFPDSLGKPDA